MIPIVNEKYKYILLYSAKAGCTSLRSLYLDVHRDELSDVQLGQLDWYHNLNEVQAFDPQRDYSDYFSYTITRNPYSRVVSAYLDQYVFARNSGVKKMMLDCPPQNNPKKPTNIDPQNFIEFLQYLKTVPDHQRDTHFQTQSFFAYADMVVTQSSPRYRWLKQKPDHAFGVQYSGDISEFDKHSIKAFKRIFKHDKQKLRNAIAAISQVKRRNASFYGEQDYPNAATLPLAELDELVFAPKPQDFYIDAEAVDLVNEIYANDFELFSYKQNEIPSKNASKEIELIPDDFNWRMYIRLNPDLPKDEIYNERSVVRHYLEFGLFEEHPRAYKIVAPIGFEWQRYLSLHVDLPKAGITNELAAIEHYISFGIRENREI